jgi:predicted ester cyclase
MSGLAFDVISGYAATQHSGDDLITDETVFTLLSTGQQWRGHEEIKGMLTYFYQVAFNAQLVTKKLFGDDRFACWEADFVGKHTGEFAGIPATGKQVNVPIAIIYEIADGKIISGDIYFEMPVLMAQLGMAPSSEASAS